MKEAGREPNAKNHEIYTKDYEFYRYIYSISPDLKDAYRCLEASQAA